MSPTEALYRLLFCTFACVCICGCVFVTGCLSGTMWLLHHRHSHLCRGSVALGPPEEHAAAPEQQEGLCASM